MATANVIAKNYIITHTIVFNNDFLYRIEHLHTGRWPRHAGGLGQDFLASRRWPAYSPWCAHTLRWPRHRRPALAPAAARAVAQDRPTLMRLRAGLKARDSP